MYAQGLVPSTAAHALLEFRVVLPGLHFVGIAAANSFGPVMRFAFGAGFAARSLTHTMMKSPSRHTARVGAQRYQRPKC